MDSSRLEQGIALTCLCAAIVLTTRAALRSRRSAAGTGKDRLEVGGEWIWLLVILIGAVLVRALGYASPNQPRFWFAERTPLWIATTLETGDSWHHWIGLLKSSQVRWLHNSPILMPVATLFQLLFGPSLHLMQFFGAFWGLLTVLAAWSLGRAAVSPAFGLAFGGFLALTPLQVTWSRLGDIPIGAGAHALFALWLAHTAGARASLGLGVLTGIVAWTTVYNYHPTRVAIALVPFALLAGLGSARVSRRKRALLLLAPVLAVSLIVVLVGGSRIRETVWPNYPKYVGNREERSFAQFATAVTDQIRRQTHRTVRLYLWADRARHFWDGQANRAQPRGLGWGMASGGLCLLPVSLLALLGTVSALRNWKRQFLWLLFVAATALIPSVSIPSARRFLLLDVAWCALAAHGLLALLRSRLFDGFSLRTLAGLCALFYLMLGGWTSTMLATLSSALPSGPRASIPFGESGFGDGNTCLGCVATARSWQDEIERNNFVVLFDSDPERELRFSPAGLPLYGKLAALAAGRPRHFVEYYGVAENFDLEPPIVGRLYDPRKTDLLTFLADRIERSRAETIVWHFERPTSWERQVAARLEILGGTRKRLGRTSLVIPSQRPTTHHPIEVRIRGRQWREAIDAVGELFGHPGGEVEAKCVRFYELTSESYSRLPVVLEALPGKSGSAPPQWVVGTNVGLSYPDNNLRLVEPASMALVPSRRGRDVLHVLTRAGSVVSYPRNEARKTTQRSVTVGPVGRNCGARIGKRWWIVDPISGKISTSNRSGWPAPRGSWTGLTRFGEEQLALAGADQRVLLLNAANGELIRDFAARVAPSRRFRFGECSHITAGDGWIATFNHFTSILAVYDPEGTTLANVHLDRLLRVPAREITAVRGHGTYLGIAHGSRAAKGARVTTLKLSMTRDCAAKSPPEPGKRRASNIPSSDKRVRRAAR